MTIRTMMTGLLLAASLLPSGGCLFRKKKPAPPPTHIPVSTPVPSTKQEPMPPPPKVDATGPPLATVPAPPQEIDVPEPPPQQPRRPRRPTTPPAQSTAQEPGPAQPPGPEPPKLVQLLTADEQRRYQAELDQFLRSAEAIVAQSSSRTLDAQQSDLVIRIRAFTQQARDQRDTDLMTARNLAQRADVLARDLQRSFR